MLTTLSRIGFATPKPPKSNEMLCFCRASQSMRRAHTTYNYGAGRAGRVSGGILNDTAPETSGCSGG